MKKINVLQLITGLGMGGAEKVVFDLAYYSDKSMLSKRVERLQEFLDKEIITLVLNKNNSLFDLFEIIILKTF